MSSDTKDLKAATDSVIASLAALSKASNDAAIATAGFFRSLDANKDTSADIKNLANTLSVLGYSVKTIDDQIPLLAAELTGKKLPLKKKVEKDPNAPKKPLTAFFKYSAHVRDNIRAERAARGEPSLSSVELTQIISQKWNELTDKQKDDWKKKYYDELVGYNKAVEKYNTDKANGTVTIIDPLPLLKLAVKVATELKQPKEESSSTTSTDKKKSKKRKSDEDEKSDEKKKEKKKDKKKKKSSD